MTSNAVGATSQQDERQLADFHVRTQSGSSQDDDDDDRLWSRTHHDYNQTIITSTVTIRVTPRDDFLVSWGCLCVLLVCAIAWAAGQVYKERTIDIRSSLSTTPRASPSGSSTDSERIALESASTAEVTRCVVSCGRLC